MNEVIITALIGAISSVAAWFAGKRRNLAETQTTEIDNAIKAVNYYREILDDIVTRHKNTVKELDELKLQLAALEEKVKKLMEENRELNTEIRKYKQLNGKEK